MKKIQRRILAIVGISMGVIIAMAVVLCNETVQKKILEAWLADCGVDAKFERVSIGIFSRGVELNGVSILFPDGTHASADRLHAEQGRFLGFMPSRLSLSEAVANNVFVTRGEVRVAVALGAFELSTEAAGTNRIQIMASAAEGKTKLWSALVDFGSSNGRELDTFSVLEVLSGADALKCSSVVTDAKTLDGITASFERVSDGTFSMSATKKNSADSQKIFAGRCILENEKMSGGFSLAWNAKTAPRLSALETLPQISASAECSLSVDMLAGTASIGGEVKSLIRDIAAKTKIFNTCPDIALYGKVSLGVSPAGLVVHEMDCRLESLTDDSKPILLAGIKACKDVKFSLSPYGTLLSGNSAGDKLLSINFNNTPLAFINPLLPGIRVAAGTLFGDLNVIADENGYVSMSGEMPLRVSSLTIARNGGNMFLENISAVIPVLVKTGADGISATAEGIMVTEENKTPLAKISASAVRQAAGTDVKTSFSLDVEKTALRQKLFSECFAELSRKDVSLHTDFKAGISDEKISVEKFRLMMISAGKMLFSAETGNLVLNRGDMLAGLSGKEMLVKVEDFPLDLFDPCTENLRFDGTLTGELSVIGEEGRLRVSNAARGIKINDFSMSERNGNKYLSGLSLWTTDDFVVVERMPDGKSRTRIGLKEAKLFGPAKNTIAEGDLNLILTGSNLRDLDGNVRGSVPGILSQPMFLEKCNVATGTFVLNGSISNERSGGEFTLDLENLSSGTSPEIKIRAVTLNFISNTPEGASKKASIVGVLTGFLNAQSVSKIRAEFSDLESPNDGGVGLKFRGKADAELIDLEDCVALVSLFSPPPKMEPAVAESSPQMANEGKSPTTESKKTSVPAAAKGSPNQENTRKEQQKSAPVNARYKSPWSGFAGTIDYTIRKLIVPENVFTDIGGTFTADENSMHISAEANKLFGGKGTGKAGISHKEKTGRFQLEAQFLGRAMALHEAVPALRAKDTKPIEGLFDLAIKAEAEAGTLDDLQNSYTCRAAMLGKNGRVRVFSANDDRVKIAGNLANLGGDLVGVLGGLARNVAPAASRMATAAHDLQKYLLDFPYERLDARVSMKAGGDLVLEKWVLRNDQILFESAGTIHPVAGREFGDWPVDINTQLSARENIGEIMSTLQMIKSENTKDGYYVGPKFHFTGTVNKMSDNFLETLYDSAGGSASPR